MHIFLICLVPFRNGFLSLQRTESRFSENWIESKEIINFPELRNRMRSEPPPIDVNVTVDVSVFLCFCHPVFEDMNSKKLCQVQQTLEPIDAIGEHVGISLSSRLGIARAKSGNMKSANEDESTHKHELSNNSSMDITDAREMDDVKRFPDECNDDHDEGQDARESNAERNRVSLFGKGEGRAPRQNLTDTSSQLRPIADAVLI